MIVPLLLGALRHSLQDRLSKGSSGKRSDEIYLKLRTGTGKSFITLCLSPFLYASHTIINRHYSGWVGLDLQHACIAIIITTTLIYSILLF
jgi:hypothetical protein